MEQMKEKQDTLEAQPPRPRPSYALASQPHCCPLLPPQEILPSTTSPAEELNLSSPPTEVVFRGCQLGEGRQQSRREARWGGWQRGAGKGGHRPEASAFARNRAGRRCVVTMSCFFAIFATPSLSHLSPPISLPPASPSTTPSRSPCRTS